MALYYADTYFSSNPAGAVQYVVLGGGGYWVFVRADWAHGTGDFVGYKYPATSRSPAAGTSTSGQPAGSGTQPGYTAPPTGYTAPPRGYTAPPTYSPTPPAQGGVGAPRASQDTRITAGSLEGQTFAYPVQGTLAGQTPRMSTLRTARPDRETRPPAPRPTPQPAQPAEQDGSYYEPEPEQSRVYWGQLQPSPDRTPPAPETDNGIFYLGQVIPPGPEGIRGALQGQAAPPAEKCDCDPRLELALGYSSDAIRDLLGKAMLLRLTKARVGARSILAGEPYPALPRFLFTHGGMPVTKDGAVVKSKVEKLGTNEYYDNIDLKPNVGPWWLFHGDYSPETWIGMQAPFVVLMSTLEQNDPDFSCDTTVRTEPPQSLDGGTPYVQQKAVPSWSANRLDPDWELDIPGNDIGGTQGYSELIAPLSPERVVTEYEGQERRVLAFADSPGLSTSMVGNVSFFSLLSGLFDNCAAKPHENCYYQEVGDRAGLYCRLDAARQSFDVYYFKCFQAGFRATCIAPQSATIQQAPHITWVAGWWLRIRPALAPITFAEPIVDPQLIINRSSGEPRIEERNYNRQLGPKYELYRDQNVVRGTTARPQLCSIAKQPAASSVTYVHVLENLTALHGKTKTESRTFLVPCVPLWATSWDRLEIEAHALTRYWAEGESVRQNLAQLMGIEANVDFKTGTAILQIP